MNIVVTGAAGFLGQHLLKRLQGRGVIYPVIRGGFDLRRPDDVAVLFGQIRPDVIFHLAAHVGGIAYNIANAGQLYYDNVMMNTLLIDRAARAGVKKFIFAGSVCAYPKWPPVPTREIHLWDGYPEESNGAYGIAKRMALSQLEAYREQFGLNYAAPILANLYGPGDHFGDKAHVIPALIDKFLTAGESVTVWGDGRPTRDFLFVEDAAEALVRLLEWDYSGVLNIASGIETSIRHLVEIITRQTGYLGQVLWDESRPNGQMRRYYDTGLAREALGWQAGVNIEEGLRRTIEWRSQFRP